MTETEAKCRSIAMNETMWTMFDRIHAQTSEFASFFENIGRVTHICEHFSRKNSWIECVTVIRWSASGV